MQYHSSCKFFLTLYQESFWFPEGNTDVSIFPNFLEIAIFQTSFAMSTQKEGTNNVIDRLGATAAVLQTALG